MRGLGRGRGFEVTDRFSLMNDALITLVIADRCRRTLNLIHGNSLQSYDAILRNRDEWIKSANSLKIQNESLQAKSRELEEYEAATEEMEYLLEKINEEVDFEFEYLEDAINYLLELVSLL